nr:hypothetical protein GCM10020185_34370 [Pseudomonas brassicacearum subsp. brassicacearum]
MNNATLRIVGVSGEYIEAKEHTVIKAGQIVGEFGSVVSELEFMTATLHPTETQVSLTYARNDVPLKTAATSDPARAVADSIEKNRNRPNLLPNPTPPSTPYSAAT